MRKGMWSAAAFVAVVLGMPAVFAADTTTVNMVEAPGDVTKTWKFEPATITIPAGSSVVWHNNGEQVHTATGDSFDTGDVGQGKDSKPIPFPTAGRFEYKCSPHPWMTAAVVVTGDASPAPTATTQPAAGGTTTTTAATAGASGASTSTTAKGGSTTTTAGTGVTSTTQAPSVTPTSGPDNAGETTTTTAAAGGGGEESAADHGGEGGAEHKEKKNSPIGIAFASVSTLLLAAIAGKLLASKP